MVLHVTVHIILFLYIQEHIQSDNPGDVEKLPVYSCVCALVHVLVDM